MCCRNLNVNKYQFFHYKVELGDECDNQLNLRSFVFDEANHERKSWKLFRRTFNRPLLVFLCQFFDKDFNLACAIVRIMLSTVKKQQFR